MTTNPMKLVFDRTEEAITELTKTSTCFTNRDIMRKLNRPPPKILLEIYKYICQHYPLLRYKARAKGQSTKYVWIKKRVKK